ncbi:hypothetical protein GCM10010492_50800 [Saccharothrix mutabilis subsp. mutabilis]|uniref:NB-ARC domain-containing protein n=1 Tax=Saccharothrix mutabilis subsp. mutabilis TaxID=66855 RepID=A0ABN0UBQ4_9PSEU
MSDVDPVGARTRAEFMLLLRRRREVAGLSYRQLERRARQDGGTLPPSTVATMLRRSTLPGPELIATFVRACGADGGEVAAWLSTRARIASAGTSGGVTEPPEPGVVVPRQLPPGVPGLVGRRSALAELDAADSGLVVVTGGPGVGKTALAVHWAHRARNRFPDGQLHVDLRDCPSTGAALANLLVGLGVQAGAVPADDRQAAALFRSVVADRRVLLLLDGATSAEQVRPLRPGAAGSCTVVTSRDRLVGLAVHDSARVVEVPPLDREHAVRLLAQALGERRVAAELSAACRLAALCDRLPLALRLAATAVDHTSATPIADLVAELLVDPFGALAVHADLRLDAAFDLSYRALDPVCRRVFRLLGTLPGAVDTAVVASAADLPLSEARGVLRRLVDGHLVVRGEADSHTVRGLLREYARGLGAPARHETAAA